MRPAVVSLTACCVLGAVAACIDLFHATDFDTLCTREPDACAARPADGARADASMPRRIEALCALSREEANRAAERACAWMGACLGPVTETMAECMLRATAAYDCTFNPGLRPREPALELWSCLGAVETCRDVQQCLYGGPPPVCGPVAAGSFRACAPEGSPQAALIECAQATLPEGSEPCALAGRTCQRIDPSRAACVGVGGATCTGAARCEGSSVIACSGGSPSLDVGFDCATRGSGTCVQSGAGPACTAEADAPACDGAATPRCISGAATSCVGGRAVSFDCTRLGLGCAAGPDVPVFDPMAACRNLDAGRCPVDSCEGDVLVSCTRGRTFRIACASLGLRACALRPREGESFARCTAPP